MVSRHADTFGFIWLTFEISISVSTLAQWRWNFISVVHSTETLQEFNISMSFQKWRSCFSEQSTGLTDFFLFFTGTTCIQTETMKAVDSVFYENNSGKTWRCWIFQILWSPLMKHYTHLTFTHCNISNTPFKSWLCFWSHQCSAQCCTVCHLKVMPSLAAVHVAFHK